MISYDDFSKLDIRIGTILSAEVVADADKLLKLEVDFGEETPRQVVSGIKKYFPDESVLIGKQCPFLVNLEPRVIRGLESQAMILAGASDEVLTLLYPSLEVAAGTKVG